MPVLSVSLRATRPIVTKFHTESPGVDVTKIYSNSPGHKINMAAKPINGKNVNLLLQNHLTDDFAIRKVASGTQELPGLVK